MAIVLVDNQQVEFLSISEISDSLSPTGQSFSIEGVGNPVTNKQGGVLVQVIDDDGDILAIGNITSITVKIGIRPRTTYTAIDLTRKLQGKPITGDFNGSIVSVLNVLLTRSEISGYFLGIRFLCSSEAQAAIIKVSYKAQFFKDILPSILSLSGFPLQYRVPIDEKIIEIFEIGYTGLAPVSRVNVADLYGSAQVGLKGVNYQEIGVIASVFQCFGRKGEFASLDDPTANSKNEYLRYRAQDGRTSYPLLESADKVLSIAITPQTAVTCLYDLIQTFAGNGVMGYSGDGGYSISAKLNSPTNLIIVGTNYYICDSLNGVIRKVDSSLIISTFAGGGTTYNFDASGDGQLATDCESFELESIGFFGSNIYLTDTSFGTLGYVDNAGIYHLVFDFTTLGAPSSFPSSLVIDQTTNDIWVCDEGKNVIYFFAGGTGSPTIFCGDSSFVQGYVEGSATVAQFKNPYAMCRDASGNFYVADYGNHVIRKIDPSGNTSLFAGTPTVSGFSGDGGLATSAQLASPSGVCLDSVGNLYIVDSSNNRIRKVATNGIISTFAGTGTQGYSGNGGIPTLADLSTQFNFGGMISSDGGHDLYFSDQANHVIRKIACESSALGTSCLLQSWVATGIFSGITAEGSATGKGFSVDITSLGVSASGTFIETITVPNTPNYDFRYIILNHLGGLTGGTRKGGRIVVYVNSDLKDYIYVEPTFMGGVNEGFLYADIFHSHVDLSSYAGQTVDLKFIYDGSTYDATSGATGSFSVIPIRVCSQPESTPYLASPDWQIPSPTLGIPYSVTHSFEAVNPSTLLPENLGIILFTSGLLNPGAAYNGQIIVNGSPVISYDQNEFQVYFLPAALSGTTVEVEFTYTLTAGFDSGASLFLFYA